MRRGVARFFGVVLLLAASGPVRAQSQDPIAFIRQVGNTLPKVLGNAQTIEEKRERLFPFIARVVDVDAVARYCMGRYWQKATPQQQKDVATLFLNVVVNLVATWSGRATNAGDKSSVQMLPPVESNGETSVPTVVKLGDAVPVHVTWVVDMHALPARILDVISEGISLRSMERSDFTAYLSHHGGNVDALVDLLRERAKTTGGIHDAAAARQTP